MTWLVCSDQRISANYGVLRTVFRISHSFEIYSLPTASSNASRMKR